MNRARRYQDELHKKVFEKYAEENGLVKGEFHSAGDLCKCLLQQMAETRPIDDKINSCFKNNKGA